MIKNYHPNLKIDYFENIDTKQKAYWLGFVFADGYVTQSQKVFRLKLSVKDETQIDKFILAIGAESDLKMYYGPYRTSGVSVEITIANADFVGCLVKLGCVTKKSLIIEFPKLNSIELDLAFLMGFFDGDGSESNTELTCSSSFFVDDLRNKFSIVSFKKKKENLFVVNLGTCLFKQMLANYSDSMPRKRKTYYRGKGSNCLDCKAFCFSKSKLCSKCANKNREKITWPSDDELAKLVWDKPRTQLAKEFGVSDRAIGRRCKLRGISQPPRGYWTNRKAKKIKVGPTGLEPVNSSVMSGVP